MVDRPVEILALPAKLHELFDGLVPQRLTQKFMLFGNGLR